MKWYGPFWLTFGLISITGIILTCLRIFWPEVGAVFVSTDMLFLKLHLLLAPAFLFIWGAIIATHVLPRITKKQKRGRKSGLIWVALILSCTIFGYALQVVTSGLKFWALAHVVTGFGMFFLAAWHWFQARKSWTPIIIGILFTLILIASFAWLQKSADSFDSDFFDSDSIDLDSIEMEGMEEMEIESEEIDLDAQSDEFSPTSKSTSDKSDKQSNKIHRKYAMGTSFQLVFEPSSCSTKDKSSMVAMKKIDQLEKLWSHYLESSEISRMNIKRIEISPITHKLLEVSEQIRQETQGLFSLHAGYLLKIRKKSPPSSPPQKPKKIASIAKKITNYTIEFSKKRAYSQFPVDTSGIGKGATLDAIRTELNKCHYTADFGGQLDIHQPNAVRIALLHPITGKTLGKLKVNHASISTSSIETHFIEEKSIRYASIINPQNGELSSRLLVSVVSDSAAFADAISTAGFFLKKSQWKNLIKKNRIRTAVILEKNGKLHYYGKDFEKVNYGS